MENLSKAREALIEAETSRKHLQERVDSLMKQVQMGEEKLAVYERRGSAISSVAAAGDGVISSTTATGESGSAQELRAEVAELR